MWIAANENEKNAYRLFLRKPVRMKIEIKEYDYEHLKVDYHGKSWPTEKGTGKFLNVWIMSPSDDDIENIYNKGIKVSKKYFSSELQNLDYNSEPVYLGFISEEYDKKTL